jgi:hypothetical protein
VSPGSTLTAPNADGRGYHIVTSTPLPPSLPTLTAPNADGRGYHIVTSTPLPPALPTRTLPNADGHGYHIAAPGEKAPATGGQGSPLDELDPTDFIDDGDDAATETATAVEDTATEAAADDAAAATLDDLLL